MSANSRSRTQAWNVVSQAKTIFAATARRRLVHRDMCCDATGMLTQPFWLTSEALHSPPGPVGQNASTVAAGEGMTSASSRTSAWGRSTRHRVRGQRPQEPVCNSCHMAPVTRTNGTAKHQLPGGSKRTSEATACVPALRRVPDPAVCRRLLWLAAVRTFAGSTNSDGGGGRGGRLRCTR